MNQRANRPSDQPGRRAGARIPLNADVEVLEPVSANGVVINASEGGLLVAIDKELPVGTVCVVAVQVEEQQTVEVARVVRIRMYPDGYLIGLSFVEDEPSEEEEGSTGEGETA